MSFKFDSKNTGVETIKAGTYEVYANAVNHTTTAKGNEMFVFNYFVRKDVEQKSGGQEIKFDNFVITDKAQWRVNQFSKAVKTPEGYDFQNAENWSKLMLLKPIKVTVKLNEKGYPDVTKIEQSEFPNPTIKPELKLAYNKPKQETTSDPFASNSQPVDISDDDLPF